MINILCIILGFSIGILISISIYEQLIKTKNENMIDYKKALDLHNLQTIRLLFINQTIKDYIKQQKDILKNTPVKSNRVSTEDLLIAGSYTALKDIEEKIKQFEKNAENLKG